MGVTVLFDGGTPLDAEESQRKMDSAINNNLDIVEACSIGLLPHDALVIKVTSEGDIQVYYEGNVNGKAVKKTTTDGK